MKHQHTLLAGLFSIIALAASSTAWAQPGDCGMGAHPAHRMGHGPDMGAPMGKDQAGPLQHLSQFKAALKITPAQEASWAKFEAFVTQQAATQQVVRDQMRAQMQAARASGTKPDPATQRASMEKMRESHQAEHRAAFQELYAVLTPEQKTIADKHMRHGEGARGHKGCPG